MTPIDELSEREGASGPSGFDGFISYSHSGDVLVAARLQEGLQRFAKPWWRRRAVRVFRDESSLAANPHLWSSITDALDASSWLVLLLSPDAAGSEWVNREVEYWLAHKSADQIVLVLTEGELVWSESGLVSDAVPPALAGVFSAEPRWVDLRFARSEEQLDLKNPRFSEAVADVASALRGVPKDELESEEVRHHRRAIRTAWAAGLLIGVLAVVSVVFGIRAAAEADRANTNAAEAEAQAAEAAAQRDIAIRNEAQAEAAAAEAQRNEAFALQKAAVAEAARLVDLATAHPDPAVVVSLSLYAVALAGEGVSEIEPQVVPLLHSALPEYRALAEFDLGGGFAAISPDGDTAYFVSSSHLELRAIDVNTGASRWSRKLESGAFRSSPLGIFVTHDGSLVVSPALDADGVRLFVVAASGGALVADFGIGRCDEAGSRLEVAGFTPDGRYLTVTEVGECDGLEGSWVRVYETTAWSEVARIRGVAARFRADSNQVLVVGDGGSAELRTFPDFEPLRVFDSDWQTGAFSADGRLLALESASRDVHILDVESGETLHVFEIDAEIDSRLAHPISFSPDGSKVAIMTVGSDLVFEVETGIQIALLHNGTTWLHSWTADSEQLFIDADSYTLWHVGDIDPVGTLPLAFDDLLDVALARVSKGFGGPICNEYRIEHCPLTADELRRMVEASRATRSD